MIKFNSSELARFRELNDIAIVEVGKHWAQSGVVDKTQVGLNIAKASFGMVAAERDLFRYGEDAQETEPVPFNSQRP